MIDWTPLLQYPPAENFCRCGVVYVSHAKIDMAIRRTVTRLPCPGCGRDDNLFRSSSPPESVTIRPREVGEIAP